MISCSAEERMDILSWLSLSVMPQNNLNSALEKCLDNTASWIFKKDFFVQWKKSGDSVLQLIGKRKS